MAIPKRSGAISVGIFPVRVLSRQNTLHLDRRLKASPDNAWSFGLPINVPSAGTKA